jgi:hypothetical protein
MIDILIRVNHFTVYIYIRASCNIYHKYLQFLFANYINEAGEKQLTVP